jgi:hypothetical protein
MIYRKVIALSALIALAFASCDSYDPFEPGQAFEVTPLFFDMEFGQTQELTATLDGQPVQVTWASSDPTVVTVNQTGPSTAVVTPVGPGTAAVTASLTSEPSRLRSASITVLPSFTILRLPDLALDAGFEFYEIEVPAGISQLDVSISGGTGDADLYVFGPGGEVCVPFLDGNEELCTFENPTSGTWEIYIEVFVPYSGVTLWAQGYP